MSIFSFHVCLYDCFFLIFWQIKCYGILRDHVMFINVWQLFLYILNFYYFVIVCIISNCFLYYGENFKEKCQVSQVVRRPSRKRLRASVQGLESLSRRKNFQKFRKYRLEVPFLWGTTSSDDMFIPKCIAISYKDYFVNIWNVTHHKVWQHKESQ